MKLGISKHTRKIWAKRIKGFWLDFSHNTIGIVGLIILIAFIFVAAFQSFVATCPPEAVFYRSPRQADEYAMPEWVGILSPTLADLPPQTVYMLNWTEQNSPPPGINATMGTTGQLIFRYNASEGGSAEPVSVYLNTSFNYLYAPMRIFTVKFDWTGSPDQVTEIKVWNKYLRFWEVKGATGSMNYMLKLNLITPNGTSYPIWDQNWYTNSTFDPHTKPAFWSKKYNGYLEMHSNIGELAVKLGYGVSQPVKMAQDIFSSKGLYTLQMEITFKPGELEGITVPLENATGTVSLSNVKFTVWGLRYGILGTDGLGHDCWSQLVYGSRISLLIGIAAAVISTFMGILVGITSGYLGGAVDESLMRLVDILLCLPMLPILLVLIAIGGYSTFWVIVIIAVFGWQGLSRLIRSTVLSLREMTYVESAFSSGASKTYVMFRHILPNIIPIATTNLVLQVPGAIILEATLSFLGMGDPTSPTWGKMLYFARETGGFQPTHMAWWDVFPPGLAITFLCLSFVFIGHAVDEIVNPRLRRRR